MLVIVLGGGWFRGVLFVCFLARLCALWDLSSLTRGQTRAPCSGSAES